MEQNPDRDYHIMGRRKAVLDAQKALAEKPSAYAALEVQDAKQRWDNMRKLELVKKKAADEECS